MTTVPRFDWCSDFHLCGGRVSDAPHRRAPVLWLRRPLSYLQSRPRYQTAWPPYICFPLSTDRWRHHTSCGKNNQMEKKKESVNRFALKNTVTNRQSYQNFRYFKLFLLSVTTASVQKKQKKRIHHSFCQCSSYQTSHVYPRFQSRLRMIVLFAPSLHYNFRLFIIFGTFTEV